MAHDNGSYLYPDRGVQRAVQEENRPSAPNLRGAGQAVLERLLPAKSAPAQPVEINPFDKAIRDYNGMREQLMLVQDELTSTKQALDASKNETAALQARMEQESHFFRTQLAKVTAERDGFGRVCIELASTINAIGQATGTVVNMTIRAQEIAQTYKERFQEAATLNNVVEELDIDIQQTLRNAGVPHKDREPAPSKEIVEAAAIGGKLPRNLF